MPTLKTTETRQFQSNLSLRIYLQNRLTKSDLAELDQAKKISMKDSERWLEISYEVID